IINRLTNVAAANVEQTWENLAALLVVAFLIAVATALCVAMSGYANSALGHLVTDSIQKVVQAKSVTLDLEYYENPLAFDKLHRAQRDAPGRPVLVVRQLAEFGQYALTLVALIAVLASFHWVIVVVLFVTSLPLVVSRLRDSRSLYDW